MIRQYSTDKIDKTNPYYDDISLLVSRQRGHDLNADTLTREHPATLLLYIENGRAVSSLRYYKRWHNIYINLVHTLEDYRGRGYSTALFNHLFSGRYCPYELEVAPDNTAAIRLYKKLGFEETSGEIIIQDKKYITMIRSPNIQDLHKK